MLTQHHLSNAIVNLLQETFMFAQADVEDHVKKCMEDQTHCDTITLDPPKLATTLSSIFHTNHSALYFSMECLCDNQKHCYVEKF